ncbi:hypothetical protein ACFLSG_03740 [Candidatus Bipolaricaulota bacterium]
MQLKERQTMRFVRISIDRCSCGMARNADSVELGHVSPEFVAAEQYLPHMGILEAKNPKNQDLSPRIGLLSSSSEAGTSALVEHLAVLRAA